MHPQQPDSEDRKLASNMRSTLQGGTPEWRPAPDFLPAINRAGKQRADGGGARALDLGVAQTVLDFAATGREAKTCRSKRANNGRRGYPQRGGRPRRVAWEKFLDWELRTIFFNLISGSFKQRYWAICCCYIFLKACISYCCPQFIYIA